MKLFSFLRAPVLCAFAFLLAPAHGELSFQEDVNAHLEKTFNPEAPGLAVLVARDGRVVFTRGFGLANVAEKIEITPETKFRIGSISKQFTAAAIVRLAEQGKLTLEDSLAKFFPDFPHGHEVTLRHLLTHTSGVHSYTDKPEFLKHVGDPVESMQLIASFRDDPPDFAPGAGFHYSNSGYFLLGEIVRQVSGKPLAEYLREQFFEPLAMKDTGVFVNRTPPPVMARGYSWNAGKFEPALDWDMSWAGGAGALYSTVGDLFRWNEALFGGHVMSEASFRAAITPVALPPNVDGMKYGYGLTMYELKGLPVIGHGGGLNGWASQLLRLPDQRCTVVALGNSLPPHPGQAPTEICQFLAEKLLAAEIAKVPEPTEDKSIDPKEFPAFAGRYDYHTGVMTVTVEDDALFAQLTGQPKFRIFPKARDEFFWKVVDAHVLFQRNEKGEVIAARHTQNGNIFQAPRLRDDVVALKPEQLDALVGQYQYAPEVILTVTREGAQLLAQVTGQPQFPIFAKSADEFEWRVVEAKIRFFKNGEGKVTKAIHTQNGAAVDALKIK